MVGHSSAVAETTFCVTVSRRFDDAISGLVAKLTCAATGAWRAMLRVQVRQRPRKDVSTTRLEKGRKKTGAFVGVLRRETAGRWSLAVSCPSWRESGGTSRCTPDARPLHSWLDTGHVISLHHMQQWLTNAPIIWIELAETSSQCGRSEVRARTSGASSLRRPDTEERRYELLHDCNMLLMLVNAPAIGVSLLCGPRAGGASGTRKLSRPGQH